MSESVISIKDLSKSFGDHEVLRKIDINVNAGEIICIVGSSGSGKSTLLRCINKLEKQTSGKILYHNKEVRDVQKEINEYRSKVGMVFQSFNLFNNMTVLENCMLCTRKVLHLPKEEAFNRAIKHLKNVGMAPYINAKPTQLSGGQKQRVGIARALANRPDVLLCDEATSALDPQTTDQILDLLLDINRRFRLTIVLITHEMHVVRKICDRVAVMENGKVVEEGDVLSVFTHPQQPITQQFVRQVSQYAEEETFNTELANDLEGTVIRLTFTGHSTHKPIVGELTLRYGLPFNILHGKMTQTAHGVFGQLWVHVVASDEQLNNILADLQHSDIEGEVIKHG